MKMNVLASASIASRGLGVNTDGAIILGDADLPAGAFTRKGASRWAGGSFIDLIPGAAPSQTTTLQTAHGSVDTSRWEQGNVTRILQRL
ncbi:MAG: hypothetical protein CAF44_008395 [Nitrospira sp. CG24D]|nr:MAG: hypothetical protein CAF44_008395 [Nitrospira sp. CG24D]